MSKDEKIKENIDTEETAEAVKDTEADDAEVNEAETAEAPEAEAPEEAAEEASEARPKKKERKLKWAKAAEEAEKHAEELEEKITAAADKYARLFAEFDNFRKRSEKEKIQRYDFGVRDIVEKILPVVDNFERGLAGVAEDKADDPFVSGMNMTYKLLMKTLEDAGIRPIEAAGKEFNPDYHNAVMHVDDPEVGDNMVVEEFQKGYMYKDQVIRYSMVKVAN
ncbi:MAG: nucleotide exchange factor GrpE [Parasporobacterium sp.]|nr:nucleotide exchange factor GrpE [Parasporobacterium sp.]